MGVLRYNMFGGKVRAVVLGAFFTVLLSQCAPALESDSYAVMAVRLCSEFNCGCVNSTVHVAPALVVWMIVPD